MSNITAFLDRSDPAFRSYVRKFRDYLKTEKRWFKTYDHLHNQYCKLSAIQRIKILYLKK